jgi:hypothetical protein
MKIRIPAFTLMGALLLVPGRNWAEAPYDGLRPALKKYLKEHGDLCLGKFDWPIGVSEFDRQIRTRDAVQMPALEKLGLVVSSEGSEKRKEGDSEKTVPVTFYELTEKGKKFYLPKETTYVSADGRKTVHHGDFCAGKLRLDAIAGWDAPKTAEGQLETTVSYTYKFSAAAWIRDPEARKVFPMVDRIIQGEGTMQLQQQFRLANGRWIAVIP